MLPKHESKVQPKKSTTKPAAKDIQVTEFPKTIAAARALESSHWAHQWALGDALVEECGPPGARGKKTGSGDKLDAAQKALKEAGFTYTIDHLRELRRTAAAYSNGERSPSESWSVHMLAGDPKIFASARREAKTAQKKLTTSFMKNYIDKKWHDELKDKLDKPPKPPKPQPDDGWGDVDRILTDLNDVLEDAKVAQKAITKIHNKLMNKDRAELSKAISEIIGTWTAIADLVKPTKAVKAAA